MNRSARFPEFGVPCAEGPSPRGELTPNGATVAVGKTVTSSCTTARIEVSTY